MPSEQHAIIWISLSTDVTVNTDWRWLIKKKKGKWKSYQQSLLLTTLEHGSGETKLANSSPKIWRLPSMSMCILLPDPPFIKSNYSATCRCRACFELAGTGRRMALTSCMSCPTHYVRAEESKSLRWFLYFTQVVEHNVQAHACMHACTHTHIHTHIKLSRSLHMHPHIHIHSLRHFSTHTYTHPSSYTHAQNS